MENKEDKQMLSTEGETTLEAIDEETSIGSGSRNFFSNIDQKIIIAFEGLFLFGLGIAIVFVINAVMNSRPKALSPIQTQPPTVTPGATPGDTMSGWKTYTNEKYSYSFEYPGNYLIDINLPEYTTLTWPVDYGNPSGEVNFVMSAFVDEGNKSNLGKPRTIEKFEEDSLMNYCAADGPDGSQYCDKVVKSGLYTTKNGIVGREIYLNQVAERHGSTTNETRGPLYVFQLNSDDTEKYRILEVQADYGTPSENNKETFSQIVSTFGFTGPSEAH